MTRYFGQPDLADEAKFMVADDKNDHAGRQKCFQLKAQVKN